MLATRRHTLSLIAALALLFPVPFADSPILGQAEARAKKSSKKPLTKARRGTKRVNRARRGKKHARKTRVCTRRRGKRRCRWMQEFAGHRANPADLRTEPVPKPSGDLWVYSENLHEELKVNLYSHDGSYDEQALAKLDNIFRCKRSGEIRAVDPKLYEVLSSVQDHFEGRKVILVSGFRNQPDRDTSRHFHASAMDIRVDGVAFSDVYQFAQTLDTGGMGIGKYPNSKFVHIDFRAPGEKSYRWTDYSGPGGDKKHNKRRRRPNS